MTNKKAGNLFEQEFCEILFENGFWVHNLAQNASGQPADVIAVKKGSWMVCSKITQREDFYDF